MTNTTFYRKANVSRADAAKSLLAKFPDADFELRKKKANAEEARLAGVKVGDLVFEASIRTSEFPPSDDDGSEESSDDAPAPKADDSSDDSAPKSDSDSDDSDSSDAPDFGGSEDDDAGLPEEKPLKGDDGIITLLQEIKDLLGSGAGPAGPGDDLGADPGMGADPLGDPGAVPDIGAPDQGEGLPAPLPGGPAGPAPLPPPVKPKSPVGVGAFAHYDAREAQITVVRQNTTGQVGNKEIISEAAEFFPTHAVAQIKRTGSAVVNGHETNLPESKIAVVTLIAK